MEWRPTECLSQKIFATHRHALLILNSPITDLATFESLWCHANYTICADGGANRLYDSFGPVHEDSPHQDFLPDTICGDLDSIRPEVEAHYDELSVPIEHDRNQESTDMEKCFRTINKWRARHPIVNGSTFDVNVIGSLGGRVDQGFSLIHHLYRASSDPHFFSGNILLFSEESISFILQKGINTIHTPLSEGFLTENVGIIPIGGPAVISTQGLEWDVTDWKTEFGGQISTSNHIKRDVIVIHTTERVLFTVERAKDEAGQERFLRDITNQ
ncbi:MAG: hypothetical protein M1835_005508 [Candelina submexicana]|nr:MAG: hypothetical protein M1835_005508 [Candelina submexicana]